VRSIAALALLAALAAWWWQRSPLPRESVAPSVAPSSGLPERAEMAEAASAASTRPAAAAPAATTPPAAATAANGAPPAPLRADLERRARAGDTRAALRLGEALRLCGDHTARTPQEREAQLVDLAARQDGPVELGHGLQLRPVDFVQIVDEMGRELDQACAGSEALERRPDDVGAGLRWVQQAADAGDAEAMRFYADHALQDFESVDQVLDAADEVRRRKARVRDYLDRAGRLGDAEVFLSRAHAFEQGVYGDDPVAAYANYFAYLRSAAAAGDGRRMPSLMLAAYAAVLTPEQRAQAEAAALRWLSPCCGGAGERP
jgi:hypothetical protein